MDIGIPASTSDVGVSQTLPLPAAMTSLAATNVLVASSPLLVVPSCPLPVEEAPYAVAMPSRYLEGEFAPLLEEYTLTDLEVIGRIPDHLDGRYLRNGANPIGEVDPALYHWFMGDGM